MRWINIFCDNKHFDANKMNLGFISVFNSMRSQPKIQTELIIFLGCKTNTVMSRDVIYKMSSYHETKRKSGIQHETNRKSGIQLKAQQNLKLTMRWINIFCDNKHFDANKMNLGFISVFNSMRSQPKIQTELIIFLGCKTNTVMSRDVIYKMSSYHETKRKSGLLTISSCSMFVFSQFRLVLNA